MAASDEYPRGWTVTQFVSGASNSITIPASVGILHVLTFMEFTVSSSPGVSSTGFVSFTGAAGAVTIGRFLADATGAAAAVQAAVNFEGQLPGIAGGSIDVTATALGATADGLLVIKGYDI